MNEALKIPGLSNSWTMPIGDRIDMLTTGIRTPVGLKIQGGDVQQIQEIGRQVEAVLSKCAGDAQRVLRSVQATATSST